MSRESPCSPSPFFRTANEASWSDGFETEISARRACRTVVATSMSLSGGGLDAWMCKTYQRYCLFGVMNVIEPVVFPLSIGFSTSSYFPISDFCTGRVAGPRANGTSDSTVYTTSSLVMFGTEMTSFSVSRAMHWTLSVFSASGSSARPVRL
eukprot:gene17623-biopygen17831